MSVELLATLRLSQNHEDPIVHDQLKLLSQLLLDCLSVAVLAQIKRHLYLLVVAILNEAFSAYESKDHLSNVLFTFLVLHLLLLLVSTPDELPHVDPHSVKFVNQNLVNLQLCL